MSQRGFTLIEMSFVIILIGLIVSGGLFAFAPMLLKARINQTNANLDQVESALELFVIRNSRLPCPADGSLPNTSANSTTYGFEQGGGTVACTITGNNAVIPWKTLGLDESYSLDGWATRLSYWPSGTVGTSTSVTTTSFLIRDGSIYPTGTFMTVTDVVSNQPVTPTTGSDQAAYVLVSHGRSQWYGWSRNSALIQPTIAVANKACNSTPDSCGAPLAVGFASGGPVGVYPPQAGTYFDDIVRWRSPAMLIQLCGSGSCGNP